MELLIVGLDGLSWNILDRFDTEPEFLSRVADKGVQGHLHSVDTPTTLPAWTSFATGKDPGTHGLTNMITQASNYEISAPSTNTTDVAAYDLLNDSLFVNLPASVDRTPAADGTFLVSSFDSEGPADAVPDPLKSLPAFEEYRTMQRDELKATPDRFINDLVEIADARAEFTRQAIAETDPNVGFVLFSVTDWLGHVLGNAEDDETRAEWVQRVVGTVDEHAQRLSEEAENSLLMSDHGFEHKHANLHLNEFLSEQGYLQEGDSDASTGANLLVDVARKVAGRSDRLYQLMRRVYNRVIAFDVLDDVRDAASFEPEYSESRAWELRFGSIHINDEYFDSPAVEDVETVRQQLIDDLESLTYEGSPVFREVLQGEEAYENPKPGTPSVIARPNQGIYPLTFRSPTGDVLSPTDTFEHRYRGIVAAQGPMFEEGASLEGMSIEDVLPTVLHALGNPVPNEMTGTIRHEILSEDRDVARCDSSAIPRPQTKNADIERNTEERLEDLGYI